MATLLAWSANARAFTASFVANVAANVAADSAASLSALARRFRVSGDMHGSVARR